MRHVGAAYAARAMRGFFTLNLPVSDTVRRDFKLDLVGALIYGIFNGSVVSYIYVVARTIGVSQTGISVLVSMGAIGAILALPVSLMPKAGGGRTFMFVAWTLGRGLLILLLLFPGPTPYMVFTSIFLVSTSVAMPFYAQVMQMIYPREYRGRLMSLVRIGSGALTTIAALISAWLLGSGRVSYQAIFAVGSALAVLGLFVFSKITPVKPSPRPRQSLHDTLAILGHNRPFAKYQLWMFLLGAGNIMTATLYPLVIVDKLHAGYGSFGVLSVITALGYLSSFFVWGRIVDRRGPVFSMLIVGICILTTPLGLLTAPSVYWLAPIMFINGIANAGYEIGPFAAVMQFSLRSPHDVPHYMALHSILAGTRGLIFPFVATFILAGHHYTMSLGTAITISSTGVFMLWRLARNEARVPELPIDEHNIAIMARKTVP